MERRSHCHGKHPSPLPPPRRARGERSRQASSGSFSASLLDAIYRSLGEGDGADVVDAPRWSEAEKAAAPPQFWWAKEAAKPRKAASADGDSRRRRETAVARPRHSGYASSNTSSSASYSFFSCSSASTTETESTTRRRHGPPPPLVSKESVAVGAEEAAAPPNSKAKKKKKKKKSRPCFPGARIRPRSPSQSSTGPVPPPSPATLACVLKALFSSARLQRKPKTPAATAPAPVPLAPPQPLCVPAASTAKAAEASERRSVRFRSDAEASVVQRRVEELVRTLEELEDGEGSDSSSDLFELESLRGAGGDELPVYGTTSLAANRAIAQRAAS
uniref:Uncharacterized protein n=1 Tax=Arundo donax TaxID=35708 RepID=A0A0A9DG07_ARUDO